MGTLHVAIHGGHAEDIPHWSLCTKADHGDHTIHEALGFTGKDFAYHTRPFGTNDAETLAEDPEIGRVEADVWPELREIFASVPMSKDPGWNCQNWVMQAIDELRKRAYLEMDEGAFAKIRSRYQKKWKDAQSAT